MRLAEWLVEHGIGEHRAMLVDGEEVIAARIFWPGELNPGAKLEAKLISKSAGTRRGVAQTGRGEQILLDHLPHELTEGAQIHVRITRAPIAERGRLKPALGRYEDARGVEDEQSRGIVATEEPGFHYPMMGVDQVRQLPTGQRLDERWEEVWHAASSGSIAFAGGEILCSVTPAMTVIDIDGDLAPRELALASVPAIARALRWFDIGGNIGIDFPTLEAKADRRAVDSALEGALADWPHERTAMNGFGFVQIVSRMGQPSLLQRVGRHRTGAAARYALRVAERAEGVGAILLLRVHPALKAKLKPEWLEELARRTGKQVRVETDPRLALEAPQAQVISA